MWLVFAQHNFFLGTKKIIIQGLAVLLCIFAVIWVCQNFFYPWEKENNENIVRKSEELFKNKVEAI